MAESAQQARRRGGIYLDFQATTPLEPRALAAMMPYLTEKFGNPHSATHRFGWEGKAGVDVARKHIAALLNAAPEEITFLSGATEANNLALKGVLEAAPETRRRLLIAETEHACVRETAAYLATRGYEVTLLPVDGDGLLRLDALEAALDERVALVSVMLVNNEIGVIQPLAEVARLAHAAGALVHSDIAQAAGKIEVDVQALGLDLASISSHKLYGPKGIGAIYVRKGVRLAPQIHGGGQEAGLRSGTLAPFLCVGFGEAAKIARERLTDDQAHVAALWRQAVKALEQSGIEWRLNGSATQRYFGNLNVSFPGIDGARLLADLRGFAVSSGAACASSVGKTSYVLEALGVESRVAQATLRIGFGRTTTADDVTEMTAAILKAVKAQREASWRQ
ncbi:cysteine desulfurase family protein [Pedomonas mirosovicensis]|uniref:cysteine desulfurase family protein n=1 Tax=Pedomonas mirosovicensis TaxID=2908641 RepID=UPI002167B207|nr:cysteine desulfurase family protein [Pedomonas mirosovicensis]MCH8685208.1 cysteine desulfurase [Pedomonas mirosovicensis]